eukprot:superscaffoldBa00000227_g2913
MNGLLEKLSKELCILHVWPWMMVADGPGGRRVVEWSKGRQGDFLSYNLKDLFNMWKLIIGYNHKLATSSLSHTIILMNCELVVFNSPLWASLLARH